MNFLNTIQSIIVKHVSCATEYLLYFLIVLIPFSIRFVFESPLNYQTGAYSDFTSLSLYISDFILMGFIVLVALFHMKQSRIPRIFLYSIITSIAWLGLELYLQSSSTHIPLQIYFSVRVIFLLVLAVSIGKVNVSREKIAALFSLLGVTQALLAIAQFYLQKSIGLYLLGESHLGPDILGVAKIVAHGTKLIRGYGTFPHPNLLAAFLVCSTILNLYLIVRSSQKSRDIFLYIGLIINIFGLFITLSRGGLLGLAFSLTTILLLFIWNKEYTPAKKVIIPIFIAIGVAIVILHPYLNTRTTISDSATKERLFYNEIGESIIKVNPIVGVGAGTSVLHMKQYSSLELSPWEIQPIHNYWLILWTEWGYGSIAIMLLLIYPIFALFKRGMSLWSKFLAGIGIGFLTLFTFDHYFYTIWPTQLLLWLIIGLIIREIYVSTTYDTVSRS